MPLQSVDPDRADGTEPEDLALYLEGLDRYREWFLGEAPAQYRDRLDEILRMFDEDIAVLRRLRGLPDEAFLSDPGRAAQVLWHLFHAFVTLLETTKWLLAQGVHAGGRPESFSEAFRWLVERGALPQEKTEVYRDLCRLRNRLAHGLDRPPSAAEVRLLLFRWVPEMEQASEHLRRLPPPGVAEEGRAGTQA